QMDRGTVLYICFFKGATDDILPKMVSTLLNLRLCEADSGKLSSLLELPGSLLIVPQATLGGEAKGRAMRVSHRHQQGGRAAAPQRLRLPARAGSGQGRPDSPTRELRQQAGVESGHQRTFHPPDGVLSRDINVPSADVAPKLAWFPVSGTFVLHTICFSHTFSLGVTSIGTSRLAQK
ncbi:unnamed protein product, partial [Tetraodon nigroviridis]